MATKKTEIYDRLEALVREKILILESENARLKSDLALVRAKLEVYERVASISDSKRTLGFGPPIIREEGNE